MYNYKKQNEDSFYIKGVKYFQNLPEYEVSDVANILFLNKLPIELKVGEITNVNTGIEFETYERAYINNRYIYMLTIHEQVARHGIILPCGVKTVGVSQAGYITIDMLSLFSDYTIPADTLVFDCNCIPLRSGIMDVVRRRELNRYLPKDKQYYDSDRYSEHALEAQFAKPPKNWDQTQEELEAEMRAMGIDF